MTARCAHCGGELPSADVEHCDDCGHVAQLAPQPIPRGPTGWCSHHPDEAITGVCARCGQFTCGLCEVSVQGVRYCESCRDAERPTFTAPVAWEERGNVGVLRGWWRTTAAITARPAVFFEQLSTEGGMGPALVYGLLGATLLMLSNAALAILGTAGNIAMLAGPAFQASQGSSVDTQFLVSVVVMSATRLLGVLVSPLATLTLYLIVAVMQHGLLRLVDAGYERGIGATLKIACYAMGVGWLCGLVPTAGPLLLFPVWWTVLMVVGTSRVHRRSTTRTLVVVVPTLALCLAPVAACFASAMVGLLMPL
jgi:hypothetical protein